MPPADTVPSSGPASTAAFGPGIDIPAYTNGTPFTLHWAQDVAYTNGGESVMWHPRVEVWCDGQVRPRSHTTFMNLSSGLQQAMKEYARPSTGSASEARQARDTHLINALDFGSKLNSSDDIKKAFRAMKQGLDEDMGITFPGSISETQRSMDSHCVLYKLIASNLIKELQRNAQGSFNMSRYHQDGDAARDSESDKPEYLYAELGQGTSGFVILDPELDYPKSCIVSLRQNLETMQWEARLDGAWPTLKNQEAEDWTRGLFEHMEAELKKDADLQEAISTLNDAPHLWYASEAARALDRASVRVLCASLGTKMGQNVVFQQTA